MTTEHLILAAYILAALRYFLFAGLAYLIFYIWKKEKFRKFKIQAAEPLKAVINSELKYSISTIAIFASVAMLVMRSPLNAYTRVYHSLSDHSAWYFIFGVFAAIFIHDTYFYWTHRLMHWKKIFPYAHHIHHKSHNPTPLAAFSFHPFEAIVEIGVLPVIVFLIPIHPLAVGIFSLYMIVLNVIGHLGFEFLPERFMQNRVLRLFNTSTHHNMHHHYSKSNFSLYFNFWDRLMGTMHKQYEAQFKNVARKAHETNTANFQQKIETINA